MCALMTDVLATATPTETTSADWLACLFHADKLPMILQAEAAECGIACLAMVSAARGQRHNLSDLRRKFSASLKGTTLKSIMDMADSLGMVGRPLRLEVEELLSLKPPCILHWDLKHYVVLKKAWRGPDIGGGRGRRYGDRKSVV